MTSCLHGRSDATKGAYWRNVEQFFASTDCGIDEAELEDVQAWAD